MGGLFEESRVFNTPATAIDSTVSSEYVIAAGNHKAYIFNTASPDEMRQIKIPHRFVSIVACHPLISSRLALVAGSHIEIHSLNHMKPQIRRTYDFAGARFISDFVWDPHDAYNFATCSIHEPIVVRDIRSIQKIAIQVGSLGGATQLKYSPLMNHIMVSSNCETLSIWDQRNPVKALTNFDVGASISCVQWHPRFRHTFLTSSKDEILRSWDFFNPDGDLVNDMSGYSRFCPCWKFWFSPDGEEYAVVKSPLALKQEAQLEVYQYPFHENTNPLKNDNSDIFVDLCWNKHPERTSKFVWALRQSKGIIRHAIVFDYSENRDEMSTPIAQSAADEEYDRLVDHEHCEAGPSAVPIVVNADVVKVLSPPKAETALTVSPEKKGITIASNHIDIQSNRHAQRSLPGSYDSGGNSINNVISGLRQSPSTSSLKNMTQRNPIGSLTSPMPLGISDFERYMLAPNMHGCDLIHELEMLSEVVFEGVTMTETNFPRAAIGFTYEHNVGGPKIEYELRYHKDFRHNGKVFIKIIQKDCPLNGTDARRLLQLMQEQSYRLVNEEKVELSRSLSRSPSFRNAPTIMTKVVRELRKLVDQLNVFPGSDATDTEKSATETAPIPVASTGIAVAEEPQSEESESSLRQSFSLNFNPSALDEFVPAPRTSGAQFDSSGFLVRFGNFRTAMRKPARSDSKLSINGSISQIMPPLDFRSLGIIDADDSDDDNSISLSNRHPIPATIFSQVPTQKINSSSSQSDEEMMQSECFQDEDVSAEEEEELSDENDTVSSDPSIGTLSENSEIKENSEEAKDISGYESSQAYNSSDSMESEHLVERISLQTAQSREALSDVDIIFADIGPNENIPNEDYDDSDDESDVCVIMQTPDDHDVIKFDDLSIEFQSSGGVPEAVRTDILSIEEICERRNTLFPNSTIREVESPEVVFDESSTESDSSFLSDLESVSKSGFARKQRRVESRRKVASVLLTAPKSSLFPFGDSTTSPKTFSEYILRMGPILQEIGTTKLSKLHGHGFGDSPPSSIPRNDDISLSRMPRAFHCQSPIQSFSLSSSPTPAALILQRNNPSTRLTSTSANRHNSSMRIRGGSLTLTDTETNQKTSSSDALVSTPVEVFDISFYLPVSKRLAKQYKLMGCMRTDQIRHNLKLAENSERDDLIDTWSIVQKYAKSVNKTELEARKCSLDFCWTDLEQDGKKYDTKTRAYKRLIKEKRAKEANLFRFAWDKGPINSKFFMDRLRAHLYHKDVQTVATVTCSLGEYCKLPPKRNELNRVPEGLTAFGLMRSSSANTGVTGIINAVMPWNGDNKTQRSASIAGAPAPLHEKQPVDSGTNGSSAPTIDGLSFLQRISDNLRRPRSSSIDEAALGHLLITGSTTNDASCGMRVIGGENPVFVFESNEDKTEVLKPVKPTPQNDDIKPLITGRTFDEFEDARVTYGEILSRWGMYKEAAEVFKYCPTQQPEPFVERVYCDKCQEIVFGDNLGVCQRCKGASIICAVCQRSCTGLLLTCPLCSHGGHLDHIRRWFKEQSVCPLGCGCLCPF